VIARCCAIVTYLHKSLQALETLHDFEVKENLPKLGLVQDVDGRWSSTYLMLEWLKRIKVPLIKTLKKQVQ